MSQPKWSRRHAYTREEHDQLVANHNRPATADPVGTHTQSRRDLGATASAASPSHDDRTEHLGDVIRIRQQRHNPPIPVANARTATKPPSLAPAGPTHQTDPQNATQEIA